MLLPKTVHLGPFYVVKKDQQLNILYVTNNLDIIESPRKIFTVSRMNWILQQDIPKGLDIGIQLQMKLRHGPNFVSGFVKRRQSRIEQGKP